MCIRDSGYDVHLVLRTARRKESHVMNVISHDPPAKDPALRLAIWVGSGIDGTVIRLCFWDGVERGHGHADVVMMPSGPFADSFFRHQPREAIWNDKTGSDQV